MPKFRPQKSQNPKKNVLILGAKKTHYIVDLFLN